MSEHKQLLEALLKDLKDALNEPYASDQAKVIIIKNLARRYCSFFENPSMFEAAIRIVAMAQGRVPRTPFDNTKPGSLFYLNRASNHICQGFEGGPVISHCYNEI